MIVSLLGTTGLRIGELTNIRIEKMQNSYIDLYAKGGKYRRIFIPQKLSNEMHEWLISERRSSGFLFLNRYGNQLSGKGISIQLKTYAQEYNINPAVVHPHAFRHLFAKNFLSQCPNLSLLADLLGHENISTTRIYLRKSSQEQQQLIDEIVTW